MNGADSLINTLVAGGVEVCFTNPGTSEMHLVAALDRQSEIRSVLGLFEGVVTAAADGYGRMTGNPACALLHLGPGLANGLANLHNARRAHTPIINLVGQHPASHLAKDAPLNSDIEAIARPYANWLRTSRSSAQLGRDGAEALMASRTPPGQIATLIVPANVAWEEGGQVPSIPGPPVAQLPPTESIEHAAKMLRSRRRTAFLLSGNALYGRGLKAAGHIADASGARLLVPYPFPRLERGAGFPVVDRIPYVPHQAIEVLKGFEQLILVGTVEPFAYFASPGKNSSLTAPGCEIHHLTKPEEHGAQALEILLSMFRRRPSLAATERASRPPLPRGGITLEGLAASIAALLPEGAIVVDESMTSGRGIMAAARGAAPHDWLANTGGSIGIALPLAVGAAVACNDRRVLCLSADGSGMYTLQALWTMAREGLNITTIIFANRAYSVLRWEFSNLGLGEPGATASSLFDIGHPDLDWVHLAKGMGISGIKVETLDDLNEALRCTLEADGPALIEVPIP
jgi:acetolactate synthase I/II/III large subunit